MKTHLKTIVILQVLLLGLTGLYAQDYSQKIDSLFKQVQILPQNSDEKIPALLQLLTYQDLAGYKPKIQCSFQQMEDLEIKESDQNYPDYLWWKAKVLLLDNKRIESVAVFKQLLNEEDSELHFKSLLGIAWAYNCNKQISDSSLYYFSKARSYAEHHNNEHDLASYYSSFADFYRFKRKTQLAKKYDKKALDYFLTHDCPCIGESKSCRRLL